MNELKLAILWWSHTTWHISLGSASSTYIGKTVLNHCFSATWCTSASAPCMTPHRNIQLVCLRWHFTASSVFLWSVPPPKQHIERPGNPGNHKIFIHSFTELSDNFWEFRTSFTRDKAWRNALEDWNTSSHSQSQWLGWIIWIACSPIVRISHR